jgi:ubiquinone/menaquinone biosynthesis C-methylase UbiE
MEIVRTVKALADPIRLRMLAAVCEEELTVGEVQEIVGSAQSAVSRNLAILRDAGFVRDRKEGTNVYFSVRSDMPQAAQALFKSLKEGIGDLPETQRDRARLEECRRRRLSRSGSYFETVAGDWERIRKSYFDDRVGSFAIEKLLPRNLILADIGCGTGSLTFELARFAEKVIGVDLSEQMLSRARHIAREKKLANIELRRGDARKLPIGSQTVDAAFCVMVLHFVAEPERAIAELCRITRPGGSVIVVDLVQHQQEWLREQMAHRWLGFDRTLIERAFQSAGADTVELELTGSYAGEKIARNGNRAVEIFVARTWLPRTSAKKNIRKSK